MNQEPIVAWSIDSYGIIHKERGLGLYYSVKELPVIRDLPPDSPYRMIIVVHTPLPNQPSMQSRTEQPNTANKPPLEEIAGFAVSPFSHTH